MDEIDRRIDLAIQTYPFAPLPKDFTRKLMLRIGSEQTSFKLSLLDFLLPGFFGLFGMGTIAAIMLTVPLLDPLWLPRLKLTFQVILDRLVLLPYWLPYLLPFLGVTGMIVMLGFMLTILLPLRSWLQSVLTR